MRQFCVIPQKTFGVIIPNILSQGIRRIERRSLLDGSLVTHVGCATGVWPSGANTVNPNSGLTEIVLTETDAQLNQITNQYSFTKGWNLISIPLKVNNPRKDFLFPNAISNAYTYIIDVGYEAKDSLELGTGYWLKFTSSKNIDITGYSVIEDTIYVSPGWNLIGSITNTVQTSDIIQEPSGLVINQYYGYHLGYYIITSLSPGKGYWVKTNSSGKLILRATK